jgi:MFS superfamily sulfate permease-like transporter
VTDSPDRTVRLVRNVLAIGVSSVLMAFVGFPAMSYEYRSGLSTLAGTVAPVAGLFLAAGVALLSLDPLEDVARRLVELWR